MCARLRVSVFLWARSTPPLLFLWMIPPPLPLRNKRSLAGPAFHPPLRCLALQSFRQLSLPRPWPSLRLLFRLPLSRPFNLELLLLLLRLVSSLLIVMLWLDLCFVSPGLQLPLLPLRPTSNKLFSRLPLATTGTLYLAVRAVAQSSVQAALPRVVETHAVDLPPSFGFVSSLLRTFRRPRARFYG